MKTPPRSLSRYMPRSMFPSLARLRASLLAASVTALVVSGTVYAQDALPKAPSDAKTIYEGLDSQGQVVRVTISKYSGAQPVVVSSHAARYPELNWTAHIGSGTAATIAH
jgi:hypothetical protein